MTRSTLIRDRQRPLVRLYRQAPEAAWVTDAASTASDTADPLHGEVRFKNADPMPFALHTAVGGESDGPVPGDILCGALATCLDSTIRVVADRLGVGLRQLSVRVEADVDVRGTLMVSPDVPVGFQRLRARVSIAADEHSDPAQIRPLLQFAEHCCVVMQTLRGGVQVDLETADDEGEVDHVA